MDGVDRSTVGAMDAGKLSFKGRMSQTEAIMWQLESDPHLSSNFATLSLLDRAPDVERLKRRMESAAAAHPRLRQRVVAPLGRLRLPEWVLDDHFDVDRHVRVVDLPAPGTQQQLQDLATHIAAGPFDRSRPLWEFVVVPRLVDGRAAMVQKFHHALTDGEGGVRLSASFLDLKRKVPPAVAPQSDDAAPHDSAPTVAQALLSSAVDAGRVQLAISRSVLAATTGFMLHPTRLPAFGNNVARTASSVLRQASTDGGAHSPLWTGQSLQRRLEVLSVPLERVREAGKVLGGSVNDVFVTAVTGAAGGYHRAQGVDVGDLRMAMPISTRVKGSGANAFVPSRVLVPAGIIDPVERFAEVSLRLDAVRGERAIGAAPQVAGALVALPTALLVRLARSQAGAVDFTASNVRGAHFELFVAGAKLLANYPLGPLACTAFNVTLLSYNQSLDIGLHVDPVAVEDAPLLRSELESNFDALFEAAGI